MNGVEQSRTELARGKSGVIKMWQEIKKRS